MLAWLLVALLGVAQDAPRKPIETAHLTVTTAAGEPVTARKTVPLHIDVSPKPTMHVYSPGQDGYIAITVTLDAEAPVAAAGKAKYPAAEKYFMPALNETQLVFSKPFRITQDVTIKKGAPAGPLTVKGTVRYQACDDKICYLPKTVPVEWVISEVRGPRSEVRLRYN
jgi:DsbC/DsbD-like thiol-disulfide interchange protein